MKKRDRQLHYWTQISLHITIFSTTNFRLILALAAAVIYSGLAFTETIGNCRAGEEENETLLRLKRIIVNDKNFHENKHNF